LFLGYIFSAVVLGVMAMQMYLYYKRNKCDKIWIKSFVAILFFANTLSVTFNLVYLYRTLILSFGNNEQFLHINWLVDIEPILTSIIVFVLQIFFAWRAYDLTSNWIYPILIVATAIISCVGGIWDASKLSRTSDFSDVIDNEASMIFWLLSGIISDGLIAIVHTWYLVQYYRRFPQDDTLVDRIIRVVVQSGLLILIVATTDLIVYLSSQTTDSDLHLIFDLPLSKVFSTTLMSLLNSREGWNLIGLADPSRILQPMTSSYDVKPGEVLQFAHDDDTTYCEELLYN